MTFGRKVSKKSQQAQQRSTVSARTQKHQERLERADFVACSLVGFVQRPYHHFFGFVRRLPLDAEPGETLHVIETNHGLRWVAFRRGEVVLLRPGERTSDSVLGTLEAANAERFTEEAKRFRTAEIVDHLLTMAGDNSDVSHAMPFQIREVSGDLQIALLVSSEHQTGFIEVSCKGGVFFSGKNQQVLAHIHIRDLDNNRSTLQ